MKKTILKLYEIQSLEIELNGFRNSNNELIITGLLNEKVNLVTKYWMTDLSNKILKEMDLIKQIRDELIRKYGTSDNGGNIIIDPNNEDGSVNLEYINFINENNILMDESKEIEHHDFKLDMISNVESNLNTPIFFKLISND